MTSSLPLLAGVALVAGLTGAPVNGTTATEHRQTEHGQTRHGRTEHGQRVAHAASPAAAPGEGDADATSSRVSVAEHAGARDASDQRRVLGYWTPRRMAAAIPIGLLGTVTRPLGAASRALHRTARVRAQATAAGAAPHGPVRADATPYDPVITGAALSGPVRAAAGTPGMMSSPVRHGNARVGGARWGSGGQIARTTGRVFLTLDGVDFVCSASSVRSANRDLVVTAGHCIKDGAGAWADNWAFVPGYDRGRQPYGRFTARRMFVAGPWAREADDSYDIGMVAVNRRGGRHLAEVAGAQEIAFGTARGRQTHGFGFPADAPYDGENLVYCAGPVRDDPHGQTSDQGLRCDMTAGSSGGPWLSGFDPVTGRGTVTSVSSFKYSDDRGTMYGPYFGETAKQLYTASEKS